MSDTTISIPRQAGIVVRSAREAQGRTRAQLAQSAGVSERLLASLELGDAPGIQLDKLLSVCGALGIELHLRYEDNLQAVDATREGEPANSGQPPAPKRRSPKSRPVDEALSYEDSWRDFMRAQGLDVPLPWENSPQR